MVFEIIFLVITKNYIVYLYIHCSKFFLFYFRFYLLIHIFPLYSLPLILFLHIYLLYNIFLILFNIYFYISIDSILINFCLSKVNFVTLGSFISIILLLNTSFISSFNSHQFVNRKLINAP